MRVIAARPLRDDALTTRVRPLFEVCVHRPRLWGPPQLAREFTDRAWLQPNKVGHHEVVASAQMRWHLFSCRPLGEVERKTGVDSEARSHDAPVTQSTAQPANHHVTAHSPQALC